MVLAWARWLAALSVTGSVLVVALSIYPGALSQALLFIVPLGMCAAFPIGLALAGALLVALGRALSPHQGSSPGPNPDAKRACPWLALALLTPTAALALLALHIPLRIAFLTARPGLARLASAPPPPVFGERDRRKLYRWCGVYRVDEFGVDDRGGVYFRVDSSAHGSVARMSYGFAHKPSPTGSPYGTAGYRLIPLGGDWFYFRAWDD